MKTLSMSTWTPLEGVEGIRENLLSWPGTQATGRGWGLYSTYDWVPPVDVEENAGEYTMAAELPAVRREDIHLTLGEGTLELTGERRRITSEEDQTRLRSERGYGKFGRTFYLPEDADPENMRAEFKEGVLTVHIPKTKGIAGTQREIPIE
jgi:HSP20 family protein